MSQAGRNSPLPCTFRNHRFREYLFSFADQGHKLLQIVRPEQGQSTTLSISSDCGAYITPAQDRHRNNIPGSKLADSILRFCREDASGHHTERLDPSAELKALRLLALKRHTT